jgi:hypothetical protein
MSVVLPRGRWHDQTSRPVSSCCGCTNNRVIGQSLSGQPSVCVCVYTLDAPSGAALGSAGVAGAQPPIWDNILLLPQAGSLTHALAHALAVPVWTIKQVGARVVAAVRFSDDAAIGKGFWTRWVNSAMPCYMIGREGRLSLYQLDWHTGRVARKRNMGCVL